MVDSIAVGPDAQQKTLKGKKKAIKDQQPQASLPSLSGLLTNLLKKRNVDVQNKDAKNFITRVQQFHIFNEPYSTLVGKIQDLTRPNLLEKDLDYDFIQDIPQNVFLNELEEFKNFLKHVQQFVTDLIKKHRLSSLVSEDAIEKAIEEYKKKVVLNDVQKRKQTAAWYIVDKSPQRLASKVDTYIAAEKARTNIGPKKDNDLEAVPRSPKHTAVCELLVQILGAWSQLAETDWVDKWFKDSSIKTVGEIIGDDFSGNLHPSEVKNMRNGSIDVTGVVQTGIINIAKLLHKDGPIYVQPSNHQVDLDIIMNITAWAAGQLHILAMDLKITRYLAPRALMCYMRQDATNLLGDFVDKLDTIDEAVAAILRDRMLKYSELSLDFQPTWVEHSPPDTFSTGIIDPELTPEELRSIKRTRLRRRRNIPEQSRKELMDEMVDIIVNGPPEEEVEEEHFTVPSLRPNPRFAAAMRLGGPGLNRTVPEYYYCNCHYCHGNQIQNNGIPRWWYSTRRT